MGRELKRVPLDFDYPLHKVWYGYFVDNISFVYLRKMRNIVKIVRSLRGSKGLIQNSMDVLNLMSISSKLRTN